MIITLSAYYSEYEVRNEEKRLQELRSGRISSWKEDETDYLSAAVMTGDLVTLAIVLSSSDYLDCDNGLITAIEREEMDMIELILDNGIHDSTLESAKGKTRNQEIIKLISRYIGK